jgi:hypothetical protein
VNNLNIDKALGLLDSGKYDALRELLVKHKNEEAENAQKAKASKSEKRNKEWGASYLALLRCYEEGISRRMLRDRAVDDLQQDKFAEIFADNPNMGEDYADEEALKFAKKEVTGNRAYEFLKQAKKLEETDSGQASLRSLIELAALPQSDFDELDKIRGTLKDGELLYWNPKEVIKDESREIISKEVTADGLFEITTFKVIKSK